MRQETMFLLLGLQHMKKLLGTLVLALSAISPVTYADNHDGVFIVGVVPQFEARVLHATWRPILDLLEEKSGYKFKLRGSPSIPTFEKELTEGKFDIAYMNPYHLVIANEYAGYIPLVRDHGRSLSGVLVVRRDSDITDPKQLNGKTLAFPAPNALGASLQMRQELEDDFGIKFKSNFVKTHDSVYLNVLLGEATAGGGVQKTLGRQKEEYQDMLRVIHKTKAVAPHPIAILPGVDEKIRERIHEALMEIGESEEGKALLSKIPMKEIGLASMDDYLPLKSLGLERFYMSPINE